MPEAVQLDPQRVEALGPAERIIQAIGRFTDHLVHNRPGLVVADGRTNIGVRWQQALWRIQEDGTKVVFLPNKQGKKVVETRVGVLDPDGKTVREGRQVVGEYRTPGLFPEVAVWLYKQVADVYQMDADLAAHWASWAFHQDRKDLKTILAAFMLVQEHAGAPVREGGEVIFFDDDFRAVGEAMMLIRRKGADLSPKQILLVGKILQLPEIHKINLDMGFTKSAKNPPMRRWRSGVSKWLRYREENPKMLEGLVKSGQARIAEDLAKMAHYKPLTEDFFKKLRWKQKQAPEGHRTIGLNMELEEKESWAELSEQEICERIIAEQPDWKVLVGQLPKGLTPAIFAAAVEAGSMSNKDLVILTPTIEELGLINVEPVASAWKRALQLAEDQRARNIARNVKTKEVQENLEEAADVATAKAIEKVTRNLRTYWSVDKSSSMEGAVASAVKCLSSFLGGFPLDRTHVSVFNTVGTEVSIKVPRARAVEHAFSKHKASGGTQYSEGVKVFARHKPQDDEDSLLIFLGDGAGESGDQLARAIEQAGIRPTGIIWGYFSGTGRWAGSRGPTVLRAANRLGIPCVELPQVEFERLFDDPYAVTQTLTALIAATPVGEAPRGAQVRRETLLEQILKTPLLDRPAWAI